MGWRLTITLHTLLFVRCSLLCAQQVSYCEPYKDRFTVRQEMLGKVGDFYWVSAITRKRVLHRDPNENTEERNFVIYDERMNVMNLIPDPPYVVSAIKEYLVTTDDHFDRLHLLSADNKSVQVRLQRYAPDGQFDGPDHDVAEFPFSEGGNSFMLVRSQDRRRILLLGFEGTSGSPRVHAFLFDQDWRVLSRNVYRHPHLTQPMIQDDYSGYPVEDFNNGPVKLANNGEWLMMAPSRANHNFLLFHLSPRDTAVICKEINMPGTSVLEDVCLSLDNSNGDVVAGVLSTFHYSTLKNVETVHYSMATKLLSFDSSYRLTTLGSKRVRNDNIVKENFVAVPGRGFLLMKEYGRPYVAEEQFEDDYDLGYDPAFLFASNDIPDPATGPSISRLPSPRYGYARYHNIVNPPWHDRGDLSMYFFPASREDSTWSGMISQEQVTELNSPNLSYMIVPMANRMVLLYNSFVHGQKMYASTTVIDPRGEQVTNEGILFWGLKNTLNFQEARQVAPDQVVVPYDVYVNGSANGKVGFAVVLFR